MKLIYSKIGLIINLEYNLLNNAVVEDNKLFEECVLDLVSDITGKNNFFILSDNEDVIEINKKLDIIISPLDLKYDKREINKQLYLYLKREMVENDLSQLINEKYSEIKAIIDQINYISDIPIKYNETIADEDLFKHFDILAQNPQGTFIEKLIEYIGVVRKLTKKNIFVLANCEAYICDDELEYLRKYSEYNEIFILFLTNKPINLKNKINTYIIDRDLCELH